MIQVYTVRYVADLMRNEPKNLGVILVNPDDPNDFASKFTGRTERDGHARFRKTSQLPSSMYKRWVEYFEGKIRAGKIDDVWRFQSKQPSQLFLQKNFEDHSGEPAESLLEKSFNELVRNNASPAEKLRDRVEQIIERSQTLFLNDYSQTVALPAGDFEIGFDYHVETSSGLAVAEAVSFGSAKPAEMKRIANDFAFRSSLLLETRDVAHSAAFVDIEQLTTCVAEAHLDQILRPIESYGTIFDVSNIERAAESVRELVSR